jgi:hypothetical protein
MRHYGNLSNHLNLLLVLHNMMSIFLSLYFVCYLFVFMSSSMTVIEIKKTEDEDYHTPPPSYIHPPPPSYLCTVYKQGYVRLKKELRVGGFKELKDRSWRYYSI